MLDKTRLRIAIQKSGRLSEDSRELLARCGIKINLQQQRLIAYAENMPIDILRVRDDDIPGLVMDGVVDLGIIGENVLEEELLSRQAQGQNPRYFTLRRLDFGTCRLSLAAPVDFSYSGAECLQDSRIATSYPFLLKRYLDQKGIRFKSCLLNGSVEVAPRAADCGENGASEVRLRHTAAHNPPVNRPRHAYGKRINRRKPVAAGQFSGRSGSCCR